VRPRLVTDSSFGFRRVSTRSQRPGAGSREPRSFAAMASSRATAEFAIATTTARHIADSHHGHGSPGARQSRTASHKRVGLSARRRSAERRSGNRFVVIPTSLRGSPSGCSRLHVNKPTTYNVVVYKNKFSMPRPPAKDPLSTPTSFRLNDEYRLLLEATAYVDRMRPAAIARQAVMAYLDSRKAEPKVRAALKALK
jgi:hypothetical protein